MGKFQDGRTTWLMIVCILVVIAMAIIVIVCIYSGIEISEKVLLAALALIATLFVTASEEPKEIVKIVADTIIKILGFYFSNKNERGKEDIEEDPSVEAKILAHKANEDAEAENNKIAMGGKKADETD